MSIGSRNGSIWLNKKLHKLTFISNPNVSIWTPKTGLLDVSGNNYKLIQPNNYAYPKVVIDKFGEQFEYTGTEPWPAIKAPDRPNATYCSYLLVLGSKIGNGIILQSNEGSSYLVINGGEIKLYIAASPHIQAVTTVSPGDSLFVIIKENFRYIYHLNNRNVITRYSNTSSPNEVILPNIMTGSNQTLRFIAQWSNTILPEPLIHHYLRNPYQLLPKTSLTFQKSNVTKRESKILGMRGPVAVSQTVPIVKTIYGTTSLPNSYKFNGAGSSIQRGLLECAIVSSNGPTSLVLQIPNRRYNTYNYIFNPALGLGLYNGLYGYKKYYDPEFSGETSNFYKHKIPATLDLVSINTNGMTLYAKASIVGAEEDIFGVYNAKVLYATAPTEGFNQGMPFIAHTNSSGSPAIAGKFNFDETLLLAVPENTVLDCFLVKYPGNTSWEFYIFDKNGLVSNATSASTYTSDYPMITDYLHCQVGSLNNPSAEGLSRITYAGGYWNRPLNMQEMLYISKNPNSLATGINKIIPMF